MPAQPVQKADRPGKDWYSVSVETLQSWGLLLVLLGLVALGVFALPALRPHSRCSARPGR